MSSLERHNHLAVIDVSSFRMSTYKETQQDPYSYYTTSVFNLNVTICPISSAPSAGVPNCHGLYCIVLCAMREVMMGQFPA